MVLDSDEEGVDGEADEVCPGSLTHVERSVVPALAVGSAVAPAAFWSLWARLDLTGLAGGTIINHHAMANGIIVGQVLWTIGDPEDPVEDEQQRREACVLLSPPPPPPPPCFWLVSGLLWDPCVTLT